MSETSEKARSDAKAKAKRYTEGKSGKVDASGWTEDEYGAGMMDTDTKKGNRPISKQNLATGGKAAHKHGGRKSRNLGGPTPVPANTAGVAAPPQSRFGFSGQSSPFLGAAGLKKGGKAKLAVGGRSRNENFNANRAVEKEALASAKAGTRYGPMNISQPPQAHVDAARLVDAANPMKMPIKRAEGGAAQDPEISGTRPTGGRIARASGGGAGKDKMNVNIIIAQKPDKDAMTPPPGAPTPAPRPPMPMGPPPGAMPPPPGGAPGGMPAGPMPGGPNMPPPSMARAAGGRTGMKYGAGSGEGRLEKIGKCD